MAAPTASGVLFEDIMMSKHELSAPQYAAANGGATPCFTSYPRSYPATDKAVENESQEVSPRGGRRLA